MLDTLGQPVAGHEAVQAGFVPQFIFHIRYPQEQFSTWFIQQASELIVRSLDFPIQIFRPSGWGLEPVVQGFHKKKPTPPDTVFSKALGGWYDIVVVMYHDQGHIPLKVKGFVYNKAEGHWDAVAGVNVTLGLPIIRSSVDHGTGFGHAGDGHANELSLVNAMDYGIRMANARNM